MKRVLKVLLAGMFAAGSIAVCAVAYGKFSDSVTVTNHISTGDINISLKELEKKNGREIVYQDNKTILPGDKISKIPRITNQSEPCWIRVKITYTDNLENRKGLDDSNLTGMSKYWIKKGKYFYCTRKLEQGDSIDVFTGISVPEEWEQPYQEKKLGIKIVADAVHATNLAPDLQKKKPGKLNVEFEGNAHKLIAAPEDFFAGFSAAMPGDVFEDSVEIRNTTGHTAEIYFRTAPECKSVKDQEFLKKLKLEISVGEKKLYSGDLLAASLNKPVSLGKIKSGKGESMKFQVTVPKELDNTYALRDGDVKWIFSVNEEEKENTILSPTPGQTEKKEKSDRGDSQKNISSEKSAPVKTGDETGILFFLFIGSTAFFTAILVLRKGGRKI
nr:hypothetical protein [uncultured Blautia sp.]